MILLPAECLLGIFLIYQLQNAREKLSPGFVMVIFLVHQYLKYTQNFRFSAKTLGGFVGVLV